MLAPTAFLGHALWAEHKGVFSGFAFDATVQAYVKTTSLIYQATAYALPRLVTELGHLKADVAPEASQINSVVLEKAGVTDPTVLVTWASIAKLCRDAGVDEILRQCEAARALVMSAARGGVSSIDQSAVKRVMKGMPTQCSVTGFAQNFFEVLH